MNKKNIYLDNNASTQVDQSVIDVMLPYFNVNYGNPSSLHSYGNIAKDALESSRNKIAELLSVSNDEIIFTSSGTESNNFTLKSIALSSGKKNGNIIVSAIEHDSILEPCKWLQRIGFKVIKISVDKEGLVNTEELINSINNDTILVSIMHANNEIGVIEPIDDIGKICHDRGVLFHTDSCQTFGKIPINLTNVDLMSFSSHKIYGPKGVGALYIKGGTKILPWQHGGGQEHGLRSATENIPAIVGFAKASELCFGEMENEHNRQTHLRNQMIDSLLKIENAYLIGPMENRLPNNINIGFHGLEGKASQLLLRFYDFGIAVSAGSACSSNKGVTSHVLTAIGLNQIEALGAVRISLGRFTTNDDIEYFIEVLPKILKTL